MEKNQLRLDLQFFAEDGGEGGSLDLDALADQLPNLYVEDESFRDEPLQDAQDGQGTEESAEGKGEPSVPTYDLGELGQATLDDIRTWKNGYMMQSDYTRKTQELARVREQLQEQIQTMEQQLREQLQQELQEKYAPYQRLEQMLQQNPEFRERFVQFMNQAPINPFPHPEIQTLKTQYEQQLKQLQEQIQILQRQEIIRQVQAEWNDLISRYPDAKDMQEEIARYADENGVRLETAYKELNFDKVRQKTQEELVKNQMRQKQMHQNPIGKQTGMKEDGFDPRKAKDLSEISRYVAKHFKFTFD